MTDKRRVTPPKEVNGLLSCPNKKCITNFEGCVTRFNSDGEKYKCYFCESQFDINEFHLS